MELSDDIFKPDMPTDLKATPADLAHLEDLVQRIGWHETLCHVCNLLFEHHAVATGTKKGALKAVARHIGFVLPGVIWCDQELKLHTPEATTNADLTAKSIDVADIARADLLSRVQAQAAAANQAAQQQYDTDSQRDLNDPVILQQNPPPPQSWLQTIAGILGNWTVTSTVVLGAAALLIPGAGPVLFAVGVGLLAASTAYSAYDRYFNQDQSGWQALLGGAADATGISAVYAGITGRDLVTQHHLSLTPAQQRQILTEGSIQAVGSALVLYGGVRSFLRGRVPVAPTGRGVWDLHPFQRGRVIEQQLGQNLPGNFPTIDRFQNGVATSIKSMDLAAPTYANAENITSTGRGYIDSVASFQGRNWAGVNIRPGDITARGLDLAVPAGATQAQQQALQSLVTYGTQNGVTVRIVVVP